MHRLAEDDKRTTPTRQAEQTPTQEVRGSTAMPPRKGATTESDAIAGNNRGRCRAFTRSSPNLKPCPPVRHSRGCPRLAAANHQLPPLTPPADGTTKTRPQEVSDVRNAALAQSREGARVSPGETRMQEQPPRRYLQRRTRRQKGVAAAGPDKQPRQDFRPRCVASTHPPARDRPNRQRQPARRSSAPRARRSEAMNEKGRRGPNPPPAEPPPSSA